MTIGSIVSLSGNSTDQRQINFAIQQLLERNGGKQVNASTSASAAYTAQTSDFMIEVTGDTAISLPAANKCPGQIYCVKKTDGSSSTASILPTSGTIDGSTSQSLNAQYDAIGLQSNGTKWDILFKVKSLSGYLQTANALSELTTNSSAARANIGIVTPAFSSTTLTTLFTTTSSSYIDVASASVTLSGTYSKCFAQFSGPVSLSGADTALLAINTDGSDSPALLSSTSLAAIPASFTYSVGSLSSGSHTIKLRARNNGGVFTVSFPFSSVANGALIFSCFA